MIHIIGLAAIFIGVLSGIALVDLGGNWRWLGIFYIMANSVILGILVALWVLRN